ncbi:MAG: clostripain-related cysteine peptidase [Terriglobales bacterium]
MSKHANSVVWTAAAIAVIAAVGLLFWNHRFPRRVEWTVLVYMNAADGLDSKALCTFAQFAEVDSGSDLNIVVELTRSATSYAANTIHCKSGLIAPATNWTGTRRYLIRRSMDTNSFLAGQAYPDRNVTDAGELKAFSQWATRHFPARHYAFIFWGHGSASPNTEAFLDKTKKRGSSRHRQVNINEGHRHFDSAFWSIYRDPNTHKPLLSMERASSIFESTFGDHGIDLIGFDSCLKGMIETAYAIHHQAKILVVSEDAIPSDGWPYDKWLPILNNSPTMAAKELGELIHKTYVDAYKAGEGFTVAQSVVDLSKIPDVVQALDNLVRVTLADSDSMAKVSSARKDRNAYGGMNAIDLMNWLDAYELSKPSPAIHSAELHLKSSLQQAIVENYGNFVTRSAFGSNGLSIYFPKTLAQYQNDRDCRAYDPNDPGNILFVQEHAWGEFLRKYWNLNGASNCKFASEPT